MLRSSTLVQKRSAFPRGFRGLFPYTEENKAGLVATTKKVLKKAFEEADEEMEKK